ncbi:MAG: carboxylesterase family protein [Acidobacteriia bacterium]|nr:carboxylesterase family protein [Terriglobia bacterium]
MTRGYWTIAIVAVIATALLFLPAGESGVVRTEGGPISGVTDSQGVTSYKGIPFAAPPLGNLRWRAPQPAARWSGVRKADHFGKACFQIQDYSRLPWSEPFMEQGPVSEDCLYLNVWTAAKSPSERRPVMVYLCGGGFVEGSGSVAVYDGTHLASHGAVVVNLNYRVGPLGFLVHPELTKESPHGSSGNYGLLDQIAALQWVQKNIAAFGGDPGRVMIFGQSAGASSVYGLMQSPLAKGLFARAVAESGMRIFAGSSDRQPTVADREQLGVRWAESKGAHSLAELRALSPDVLFKSAEAGGPALPSQPVTDGWVLPAPGSAPPASEVPLIVGMVADDIGVNPPDFGPGQKPSVASYRDAAKKKYGDKADEFLNLYPVTSDENAAATKKDAARDQARVSIDLWSANQVKLSGRVYTYYFDRAIPWPEHPEFGAFHTSEVPYVFGNLELTRHPFEPIDQQVSDAFSSYWMNFAASGDPNGKSLANWPPYKADAHKTMELGTKMGPMPETATPERLAFQIAYLKKPAQPSGGMSNRGRNIE